jgi:hypothetical protein
MPVAGSVPTVFLGNCTFKYIQDTKYEIFMAVTMKSIIFWDVTMYSLVEVYQCFRETVPLSTE